MTKTFVTGEVLTASDVNTYLVNNGYQYAGTRYDTSSGSFDKADPLGTGDIGLKAIRVRLVGGGGAGGGAAGTTSGESSVGQGGGGGGYAESFITNIAALGTSVTVTVGAGGNGNSGAAGDAGGASSFGSGESYEVSATGGAGGSGGGTVSDNRIVEISLGGALTAGDFGFDGGEGFGARFSTSRDTQGGFGGSSAFAGSTGPTHSSSSSSGSAGRLGNFYGGGGSGAFSRNTSASADAGGAGGSGVVIIDCFV